MSDFETNPKPLRAILDAAKSGEMKLPEFQRSWVWDEDRIKSLISSVSQDFPIGAIMTLKTGGEVKFKERAVEGAPDAANDVPAQSLILDGQQRITSLYQTCYRSEVVETVTARKKKVERWFYIDMKSAMDDAIDPEDTIVGVPADRIVRTNFGRDTVLDLSSSEKEYENRMFPVWKVFHSQDWQNGFLSYWNDRYQAHTLFGGEITWFNNFKGAILDKFTNYSVPLIAMPNSTSRQAICLVFEKVNTGGKVLDTFELVTATYAASGFNLREDWLGANGKPGRKQRLAKCCSFGGHSLLNEVSSVDFLQTVSLLATSQNPPVSATRKSLLNLALDDYRCFADTAQRGFEEAAKFLLDLNIFRVLDVPYRSQLVPLAAILAKLGNSAANLAVRERIARWYWCGVFGELYGSATETRFAKDVVEVPLWVVDADRPEPATVAASVFRADRLLTLRTRQSAAYKGVMALLMDAGKVQDWLSGKPYKIQVFFDEAVDIHHVFPLDWCRREQNKIPEGDANSIVNKTPLSARTNRSLGGRAPSEYLKRIEQGTSDSLPIRPEQLDTHLQSHQIAPEYLRADNFREFFKARQKSLLSLIEKATGKQVFRETATNEPEKDVPDEEDATT